MSTDETVGREKTALVTGASRGIGRAVALALADAGYRVVGTARPSPELDQLGAELAGAATPGWVIPSDLRDPAAVDRLFAKLAERTEQLDVLINNAGIARIEPFCDTTFAAWRVVLSTNVDAVFLVTAPVVEKMVEQGEGHVVFIASDAAVRGISRMAPYCASKHAILGLARALVEELRGTGVRITTVLPGPVNTTILHGEADRLDLPQPEDVASCVLLALTLPARAQVQELLLVPSRT